MTQYRLKPGRLGKKLLRLYRRIETAFVDTFLEPDGSLRIGPRGRAVVRTYHRLERAFVDAFLEKTGEESGPARQQTAQDVHYTEERRNQK